MREFTKDKFGNEVGPVYSNIITNVDFERRLKELDPNLKLMFDQLRKRWVILEWALDNSGWNLIESCTSEDINNNPNKIINTLFVRLHNAALARQNPDGYFNNLLAQAEDEANRIDNHTSEEAQYRVRHDINEFKRGWKEVNNEPTSDVTAGYPKINKENLCIQ